MGKQYNWRILVLTDFFFPDSTGGGNKMAFYTSRGLADLGHRISLITRRVTPDLPDRETIQGIEVYRYDLPRKTLTNFLFSSRQRIWKILNFLREKDPTPLDLLIIHQSLVAAAAGTHSLIRNVPRIYNFHSSWGEEFMISRSVRPCRYGWWKPAILLQKSIRGRIEAKVLGGCQSIIVLSKFMQKRLEKIHGPTQKIVIVPGGVDTEIFHPPVDGAAVRRALQLPTDQVVLFTVRNLRQRMGIANLIRAMADLGEIKGKVHLVIAGKGELEEELKRLAVEMRVADRITFLGHVTEEGLPKFYQAGDLFILPTEHLEGFGMVTLEAIATGLPVIGTPVGATTEILCQIGEEWLSKDSSSKGLAGKIKERVKWLMEHPTEYQSLRQNCREIAVGKYSWPKIIKQWEAICEKVIQD